MRRWILAPAVAASQQLRVVTVADDDPERARQVAHDYGAEAWSTDARAALDRADVDIVVALYSCDRNVAICQEAAALGKHIVSVKPMALDLAGADAIVAAVRSAGVHFFPLECGSARQRRRAAHQALDRRGAHRSPAALPAVAAQQPADRLARQPGHQHLVARPGARARRRVDRPLDLRHRHAALGIWQRAGVDRGWPASSATPSYRWRTSASPP